MKIIFYRHSLLSRGGDKMFLFYANGLADEGHDITLYCNVASSVFPISPAVHLKQIPWPGKAGTILFALLHKFGADRMVADIIPLAVTLSFRNLPIYFAQDLSTSYYTSALMIGLMRFLLRWGIGKKKIPTIAVSDALADELRFLTKTTVDVICNGIDGAVFYREPDTELIASKKGKKALLLHAGADRRKGFDIACQVVRALVSNQTLPDFVVWTVGERTSDRFWGKIEHRDFGYVGEQQLRQLMSSADIFLYPSRHEGMGLMPLEAMGCGCAVVTTTAVPYVRHGDNAFVAQVEDVDTMAKYVLELLQAPSTCSRLSKNGKQFTQQKKYSLSESVQRFESVLAERMKNGN